MANGELLLNHYLAMSPGFDDDSVVGIETVEPAFGLPALWVKKRIRRMRSWPATRWSIRRPSLPPI